MSAGTRSALEHFIRTGRRFPVPVFRKSGGVEQKFNPNHDPRDGRFTFTISGVSVGRAINPVARAVRPPARSGSRTRRGGNGGPPMEDPLTIEQMVPGIANSPAGSILAIADNMLDLTGPARAATDELTRTHMRAMIRQIQAVDPNYRFDSLGFPATLEGQNNMLRDIRLDRAAVFYRVRGEVRPLQVETLKFLQGRVDLAYIEGVNRFKKGQLTPRLSSNEAIGNFVDRQVRGELRDFYRRKSISIEKGQQVQVNRRAHDSAESSYTVPDSRVGNVAFDVSLTPKTLAFRQIQGFFRSDFQPSAVVIVRPTQLGPNSSYIITRPGGR
jgi:hypothetical protein